MSEPYFCTGKIWCSCCQKTYANTAAYNTAHRTQPSKQQTNYTQQTINQSVSDQNLTGGEV